MDIKRIALLAGMALAAIAFAAPATSSASGTWTEDHLKLKKDAVVDLTGKAGFSAGVIGKFECEVHIKAKLTASYGKGTGVRTGTGHVENYVVTLDTCVGTGAFSGCELGEYEATNLGWMLTATETDIDIIDVVKIHYDFMNCIVGETTLELASTTLKLNDAQTFSHIEISGTASSGAVATGTLEPEAEAAGTYGVHEPKKPGEEEEEEEGRLFN